MSAACWASISFNTQPPEGGWLSRAAGWTAARSFNTQPPEGGWLKFSDAEKYRDSFNTQPPEGGWADPAIFSQNGGVSTHSRLKAAGAVGIFCIRAFMF